METPINSSRIVAACKNAFSRGYAFDVAARHGELTAGSQVGLISDSWQEAMGEFDVQGFLEHHRSEIESEWRQSFERLKRIIDFGGLLGYEEMMQVLTLRSELEFCNHDVNEDCQERIMSLDKELRHMIADNRQVQSQCADQVKNTVCQKLDSHWWWSESNGPK